ncbi:MAG: M56 family metallopeptidase, partial [Candidatus Cyclobacteriaceae bacterium M3_2C_046]
FFNHIYLPASFYKPGKNLEVILNHENVHQRQWHSLDRLLMELFLVYQWFNPLAWLLRKEMILVHEYLADRNLSRVQDQVDYQQSLLKHLLARTTLSLGNNFSAHLKKRIKMMNRSMTPGWLKAKYVFALPLVAVLLIISS